MVEKTIVNSLLALCDYRKEETGLQDVSKAVIPIITEEQLAKWKCELGDKVIWHNRHYWMEKPAGFYHSLHAMARIRAEDVSRPTAMCWGFRATVAGDDTDNANATMPVHLLSNIENYDLSALSSSRRNKVKNCRKRVDMIELTSPDVLLEQGYEVLISAQNRTQYGGHISLPRYIREINSYFKSPRTLVLGGLVNGKLGGYLVLYAIGKTAYIDKVCLSTEALSTNIGTGLIYESIQACRRTVGIHEVVYGLHAREDPSLCRYKSEMDFPVSYVPARVWFAPLVEKFIKKYRPHTYYRLTGYQQ